MATDYQKIFDYLLDNHSVTLIESEMNDLIDVVISSVNQWKDSSIVSPVNEKMVLAYRNGGINPDITWSENVIDFPDDYESWTEIPKRGS